MKEIDGGISAVQGVRSAGVACGIKADGGMDLAIICCDEPVTAAGVYTRNRVKAAPVLVSRERTKRGKAQAIVASSGNATACTGERGLRDARRMAELAAGELRIDPELVLVASTGTIGRPLPMDRVEKGIRQAASELDIAGGHQVARAIMTTDTFPKEVALEFDLHGKKARIAGIVKGAGMIMPDMATMLCFIVTDAAIDHAVLQEALKATVDASFNMVCVDGDMSTNDTVIVLANGMAGNDRIREKNDDYERFLEALGRVTLSLAKMIAKDGEGATKFIELRINGARNPRDAKMIALSIARSPLVKTAMFGEQVNWGRFMSSIGASGAKIDGSAIDMWLDDVKIAENSVNAGFDEDRAKEVLKKDEFVVTVDLKAGEAHAAMWTCDLSYDYVKCNI